MNKELLDNPIYSRLYNAHHSGMYVNLTLKDIIKNPCGSIYETDKTGISEKDKTGIFEVSGFYNTENGKEV